MKTIRIFLATVTLFAAGPALADGPVSVYSIEADVKADKAAVKDANKDLREIERLQRKWEKAREKGNDNKLAKFDDQLDEWIRDELVENLADRKAAKNEFIRMGGDPAVLTPRANKKKTKAFVPPRARDDQQDFIKVRSHFANTRQLATEIRGIQPAFTHGTAGRGLYEAKSDLIQALVVGAKRDIKRAEQELTEDERHLARRT